MTITVSSKEASVYYAAHGLQVIIPTLDEVTTICDILNEVSKYTDRIIVVDGGSGDGTLEIAHKLGAYVVKQNGKGKGDALCQAFQEVDGGIVLTIDADGSMKPSEIPYFIDEINTGADLVKGSRFLNPGYSEDMSFLRYLGNRFFVKLINFLYSERFSDLCYGYIALTNDAVKRLTPMLRSRNFEIETEIIIKAKKLGLKIAEVPSIELKRAHGKSKLRTLRDGFSILKVILKEKFS
jgi:glycosyltransferase involved in cell wall biosynthesis